MAKLMAKDVRVSIGGSGSVETGRLIISMSVSVVLATSNTMVIRA